MKNKAQLEIAKQWNSKPTVIPVDEGKELRCPNCNKLLGKGEAGKIEIKCPRCGLLCRFQYLGGGETS